ncbi:GIY-YIG nuclease family protein [Alteribacter keqinensis]|uniref:GIY-YIG nuclease family protein n=1 Tax=Alteribacter keqinensis TaxID=2483800 RepID=A0A3M7TKQ7_9BACI|nr:GIY-YIG nuclease family protein [Alteribacter keqinensis]RNA66062.1 GIY-YIG nuclease family protein [Alteribacter keqinensis]
MNHGSHYVYILECNDGTYYTGYTTNVEKRLQAHASGLGAKYTRGRAPLEVVYEELFLSKGEALKAEYRIKQLSKAQKRALILKKGCFGKRV